MEWTLTTQNGIEVQSDGVLTTRQERNVRHEVSISDTLAWKAQKMKNYCLQD
ncbi:hypothetical protein SAMN05216302_100225 [Nitrosomonas aestuarii]|uniref:Uncharacterized protein n=1 Tax=Nitrosomonas aestuarii TaxID=52441 RepID=A0A1I3XPT6_9PROT|nr:hypothetical protein SAMN05216302_100225 [Nitrosomonas aestuarii]